MPKRYPFIHPAHTISITSVETIPFLLCQYYIANNFYYLSIIHYFYYLLLYDQKSIQFSIELYEKLAFFTNFLILF